MKIRRWTLALILALAMTVAGCVLISGQFLVDFDLGTIRVASPTTVVGHDIDLNTIGAYRDHKNNLKDVADLSILGEFTNNSASDSVAVELWITPNLTSYMTEAQVRANGVRVWGPVQLAPGETRRTTWDASAGLLHTVGKARLVDEIRGDGSFTLYAIGSSASYDFLLADGHVVIIIDAGV